MNANLARETDVIRKLCFHCQTIAFEFAHFAWIAGENFNAARGAASVASATMKNVDAGIFNRQD